MMVYERQRLTGALTISASAARAPNVPARPAPAPASGLEHRLSRISTLPRELEPVVPLRAAPVEAPVFAQTVREPVQRVQWATLGTIGGAAAGALGATMLTGGLLPLAAAGVYGAGAIAGAIAGRFGGQALDHRDLKSMSGLASFQSDAGGNSQGTLLLAHAGDGNYYMIEQQTNNSVAKAAAARGIKYIPQPRESGVHAEVRFIDWGRNTGVLSNSNVWVSKPICKYCGDALRDDKVSPQTVINDVEYAVWVPPSGKERPVSSTGIFRGRRPEAERLQDRLGFK